MKLRVDFVTNSSSSSFIVISKINYCADLVNYMKEEYGRYGERLLNELILEMRDPSKYITEKVEQEIAIYGDDTSAIDFDGYYVPKRVIETLKQGDQYLIASYIETTNDGDSNGDDAWLMDHIPSKYKEEIYQDKPYWFNNWKENSNLWKFGLIL